MSGDDVPALDSRSLVHASGYAREVLRRWRLEPGWLDGEESADDPELAIEARLRRLRQLEGLRIQWREIRGEHDVEETGRLLSGLAETCIERALERAEATVAERHGHLVDESGRRCRLAVLALGKLGGNELNFNSDVDLVFCHEASGQSDGRRPLGPRDWFGRVVRELTRILEEITRDGRVWVVDTRLRPFGQSGAMVWSLSAMEQYFLNEGRTWERYAWLKARDVAGDRALGRGLLERIGPFVFRRYLDYGLFESLRSLHGDIERRSQREDLQADIKRGPGGIRELEFLVQSLQLLRGGREPSLRVTGFLPALRAARDAGLVEADEAAEVDTNYRYLRALENRIQLATGRQTHEMPDDDEVAARLALLTGHGNAGGLDDETRAVRRAVRERFRLRFDEPGDGESSVSALWPPTDDLGAELERAGFRRPEDAAAALVRLHERLSRRPSSAEARQRLDRLMPDLLDEVLEHRPPDVGFTDLLALIETVARRSAYLALLRERPATLARCVRVFRASERVARWITASPQLLDDLLAPDRNPDLPRLPTMQPGDVEHNLNSLARFRQAGFVRTALGQLDGSLDRAEARERLTRLAEQVLEQIAEMHLPDDTTTAIIGYGNLGAGELHYTSDLDLVFLHDGDDAPLRAVQRLINAMQLPLQGGKLYAIDTRLRPNGNAGMLVSSLDSFADYQHRHAWTWEHQALIRARCVSGTDAVAERFERIRRDVLRRGRDEEDVRQALFDMRRRQLAERSESPAKRLLGDIQFIAEFGVLISARQHPDLLNDRATIAQLAALSDCGWLDGRTARSLTGIFNEAAGLRDRRFLERDCDEALPDSARTEVAEAWKRRFGAAPEHGSKGGVR
ncbi:MAG: bifunctional [glutamate--ammonia ligase]-adenylyl-L-tyrosine phosphorylase/[glutamate--ammonia-ligase] adenylyltransferase [Candidatus Wenzhouxiangella sp. M2_3B_020]